MAERQWGRTSYVSNKTVDNDGFITVEEKKKKLATRRKSGSSNSNISQDINKTDKRSGSYGGKPSDHYKPSVGPYSKLRNEFEKKSPLVLSQIFANRKQYIETSAIKLADDKWDEFLDN